MASEREHKEKLVARYANNEASEKELQAFFGLLSDDELRRFLEEDMDEEIQSIREVLPLKRKIALWPWLARIVAAIAFIILSILFFWESDSKSTNTGIVAKNDVAPAKNKATLSLGNDKTITLSEEKRGVVIDASSELTYSDGTKVNSSVGGISNSDGKEQLAVSTPKGGAYQVVLPDGTKAWLNAATTLKFYKNFRNASQRRVELIGEAYFEVTKDKKHPFIVVSGEQEVEVLGTHFNINNYPSEGKIRTTLLEGSIKVKYQSKDYLLIPGNQAEIGDRVKILNVDSDQVIAWMKGDFNFKDEHIRSIMRKLERWYDIEVVYEGKISDINYGAEISRDKSLAQVLKILEKTGSVHFKIEGRRVTVMQ